MEDFELTKKPDIGIFDRRFPAMFDDPIYDLTKMTIIQGTDGVLDDLFSYQVYNKLKNHWRLDVEPADRQVGMIWSESGGNDKLYHYGEVGGDAWEEILQVTRSSDKSPYFANLYLAEYIYHTGDLDTYIRFQNDQIDMVAGAFDFITIVKGGTNYLKLVDGLVFIADTANTKMTKGLTINQGVADDEILAFKSLGDVAHGMTDVAETDTYGNFAKAVASDGGLVIRGFSEDIYGLNLIGVATNDNTDKDATGLAPIVLDARKKSGTSWGVVGANANLVVMRNHTTTRWILDEDGDTWQPGEITCASLSSLVLGAPTELTIAGGAITVTRSYHRIDGAGDAADNLDTINGGVDGMILVLQSEHNDRDITIREVGNIDLNVAGNFVLTTTHDKIILIYNALTTYWEEISRSDNLA